MITDYHIPDDREIENKLAHTEHLSPQPKISDSELVLHLIREIASLRKEMLFLRSEISMNTAQVARITKRYRIETIKGSMDRSIYIVPTTYGEGLPMPQIKEIILEHVKIGQKFYPSDIAATHGLDLEQVVEAVQQLKQEGRLKELE